MIVVRTHGGIGNQIFQIAYARLLAARLGETRVRRAHDVRYPHRFGPCEDFEVTPVGDGLHSLLSWVRLPKLANRARLTAGESARLGPIRLLDGYFQDARLYSGFTRVAIDSEVARIRRELRIEPADRGRLIHMRLGDFFRTEDEALAHVEMRFAELAGGGDLISNRDDLFAQPHHAARLAARNIRYVPTERFEARQVLDLMAHYSHIESNNSTLAFWAAVLGGGSLSGHDANQAALLDYFRGDGGVAPIVAKAASR